MKKLWQKLVSWCWVDANAHSIISGEVRYWEYNWLTGYSRLEGEE